MWTTKFNTSAAVLAATITVTVGALPAQQPPAPKPADSAEMAQTEAKLARLRELIRPQPGEYVTNMAKIAWERDPWQAAVKAAREGKPVLSYGVGSVGVTCGYGWTLCIAVQVCTFRNMDDATVKLINKEFVPLVTNAWGFGEILTARGEVIAPRLVSADTGGPNGANNPFAPKRLHAALEKFKQLPPEKRKATVEELPISWKGKAEPNPPAEGLILKQYRRGFHRDAKGEMHRQELHHDWLWMTRAEWQSLVPERPRVGDSTTVPEFLLARIGRHHAQIVNPSTSLRIGAAPKPTLTSIVEFVSPDQVRLRLQGSFQVTEYQPVPGGTLTNGIIDYQVCGCLQYDVKKKTISRLDLTALGDVTNIRKDSVPPKGRTMVSGLLFEQSPGAVPWDRTPPYDRVSAGGGEAVYFKAGQ